jgi:hypothetical protein
MRHLVEWDSIDLRVDGEKLAAMAREIVRKEPSIEKLDLRFSNGLLRVEGAVRRFILVPFSIDIRRIEAKGMNVHVPLERISAGPIPIPRLLVGLARDQFPKDLVGFEEPATLIVSLDRFLPSFVTADIKQISIIDGGLAVTLGRGGADLPTGGSS